MVYDALIAPFTEFEFMRRALAAVPWDDFRPLFEEHSKTLPWKTASYLSLEQQRRRQRSLAWYLPPVPETFQSPASVRGG